MQVRKRFDFVSEIINKQQEIVIKEIKPLSITIEMYEFDLVSNEFDSSGMITTLVFFNDQGNLVREEYIDYDGSNLSINEYKYYPSQLIKSRTISDFQSQTITYYSYEYNLHDEQIKYFYFQFAPDDNFYYIANKVYNSTGQLSKETFVRDSNIIAERRLFYDVTGRLIQEYVINSESTILRKTVYDYSDDSSLVREKFYSDDIISHINEKYYTGSQLYKLIQSDSENKTVAVYEFTFDSDRLTSVKELRYKGNEDVVKDYIYEYTSSGLIEKEKFYINGDPVYYQVYRYRFMN